MLCRRDDGSGFILNPYLDEVIRNSINQRRRFYFKHGVLKVERLPIAKNLFVLRYKGRYIASWTDIDSGIAAHTLITGVCNALDVVLGVDNGFI